MASTTIYPTTIFPTIGRRNAVLMFLMGLGLILAIGWFLNGISIEPTNAIDQQVRYLSYVISAAGWIIFTLALFLGIMISQLDVITQELRQLRSVPAAPTASQPASPRLPAACSRAASRTVGVGFTTTNSERSDPDASFPNGASNSANASPSLSLLTPA